MATENKLQWVNRKVREGVDAILETDVRTGLPGGMLYNAKAEAVAPTVVKGGLQSGDFSYTWVGIPQQGAFCCFTGDGVNGYFIHSFRVDGSVLFVDDDGVHTAVQDQTVITRPSVYSYKYIASTVTIEWSINGNIVISTGPLVGGTHNAPAAAKDGYVYPFTGVCYRSRIVNFAMTTEEALGASRGEVVGRLAYQAARFNGLTGHIKGNDAGNSVIGDTISSSSGGWTGIYIPPLANGQKLIVRGEVLVGTAGFNVTNFTGSVPYTPASGILSVGVFMYSGLGQNIVGIATDGSINMYPSPGGSIRIDSIEVEGTIANYAPENCTSANRWLDNSGNGYDLLPTTGTVALAPQPLQTRHTIGVYRLATPAVISGPSYITQTRQGNPGLLRLTFPDWMLNQLQVKTMTGTYNGDPAITFGNISPISNYIDTYCYKTTGTPGYVNEDIAWESTHLE